MNSIEINDLIKVSLIKTLNRVARSRRELIKNDVNGRAAYLPSGSVR